MTLKGDKKLTVGLWLIFAPPVLIAFGSFAQNVLNAVTSFQPPVILFLPLNAITSLAFLAWLPGFIIGAILIRQTIRRHPELKRGLLLIAGPITICSTAALLILLVSLLIVAFSLVTQPHLGLSLNDRLYYYSYTTVRQIAYYGLFYIGVACAIAVVPCAIIGSVLLKRKGARRA